MNRQQLLWMPDYNIRAHLHPLPLRFASGTSCVQCGVTELQTKVEADESRADLAGFRQLIWSTRPTSLARGKHLLIIGKNLPGLSAFCIPIGGAPKSPFRIPHLRNGLARRRVLKPRRRACLIFARLPASSKGDGTARPGAWSAGSLGCLVYAAVTA